MFRFKRFSICQDRTAMKVGTDGVLLGSWVAINGDERRVLDIGTGTGLIALMIAQRVDNKDVAIDAVEIDKDSAEQATENILNSDWKSQISVHNIDIQSFKADGSYDLIISNPPYFVDSLRSPIESRTTARHTTNLTFSELIDSAVRLLSPNGRFAVVLPIEESKIFDSIASEKLSILRRCEVFGRFGMPAKRYITEYELFSLNGGDFELEQLTIESGERHDYTEEYRRLTRDFYLKF